MSVYPCMYPLYFEAQQRNVSDLSSAALPQG